MRAIAKLIFSLGILMIASVAVTATNRTTGGGVVETVADIVGERSFDFADVLSSVTTKRETLVTYLPGAQMGWKPEPWSPEIRHLMNMSRIPSVGPDPDHPEPERYVAPGVVNLAAITELPGTIVYRRGSEIIEISIHYRVGGIRGALLDQFDSTGEREAFAKFSGIVFYEKLNLLGGRDGLARNFRARISEKIDIEVRARSRDGAIKGLLSRIDYDGLIAIVGKQAKDESKPSVNTLPQIAVPQRGPYDGGKSPEEMERDMLDAAAPLYRLLRWFGQGPQKKEDGSKRVVVNRGGREGCETNRGGCPMSTLSLP